MGYGYFPYIQGGLTPIIYDGSGQQLIALSHAAPLTTLVGAEAAGDNLRLKANSIDDYSRITLLGGGSLALVGQGGVVFYEQATKMAEISYASNITTIEGGSVSGDDLTLKANGTDARSYIQLLGNGDIILQPVAAIQLHNSSAFYTQLHADATTFTIQTTDGRDIYLHCGNVKFGTYTAGAATDSTGYITIKDAAGNTRKLMVQA